MSALEISDSQMSNLLVALESMPVPSVFPEGAREAGSPFVERHHVAGGEIVYTVWHGLTVHSFLDYTWKAADAFLELLGAAGLELPSLSVSTAQESR